MSAFRLLRSGKAAGGFLILVLILSLSGCGAKEPAVIVDLGNGLVEDPTVWYVATTGTDVSGACHSPAAACKTIQFVIDQAANGHTIHIADGVYPGQVVVDLNVAIIGSGPNTILENPVAKESQPYRGGVLLVECNQCDGSASISDLTVRNGSAVSGGGIGVQYMTLTLRNVVIESSSASYGGCLSVANESAAILEQVTLTGCQVDGEGGGVNNDGDLTMTDSRIVGNISTYRGGGLSNSGTATLTGVRVENNIAAEIGGGIINHDILTITASTIVGNEAADSGGFDNYGDATIVASTFSSNKGNAGAGIDHGGTVSRSGSLYMYNVTISGNEGWGIRVGNEYQTFYGAFLTFADNTSAGIQVMAPTSIYLVNSLLARNGDSLNCGFMYGGQLSGHSNQASDDSCTFSDGAYPALADRLGPLQDNGGSTQTHALLPGSPAIDAGANLSYNQTAVDQRGAARPLDGDGDGQPRNDIGAYEYSLQAAVIPSDAWRTPLPQPVLFVPEGPGNCRQGPAVVYPGVDFVQANLIYPVDGRNETGDWVRLMLTADRSCWVKADIGALHGDPQGVAVLVAPPTPIPTEVPTAVVACSTYTSQSACEMHAECRWKLDPTGSPVGPCESR